MVPLSHATHAIDTAVIAAAGKGTRASPESDLLHKTLFKIHGKTLLRHNIELVIHQLGLAEIYVIVGHLKEQVCEEIDAIQQDHPDVKISPVEWSQRGLCADVAKVMSKIKKGFFLLLGDEFYQHSDHINLRSLLSSNNGFDALVVFKETDESEAIKKNFSLTMDLLTHQPRYQVKALLEKPTKTFNNWLGVGSYILTTRFLESYEKMHRDSQNECELTAVLNFMAQDSGKVFAHPLSGQYFNINSFGDYQNMLKELESGSLL